MRRARPQLYRSGRRARRGRRAACREKELCGPILTGTTKVSKNTKKGSGFGVQEKFTCLTLVRCNRNATKYPCLRSQVATSKRSRPCRSLSSGLPGAGRSRRLVVPCREADAAPFRRRWRRHELPDGLETIWNFSSCPPSFFSSSASLAAKSLCVASAQYARQHGDALFGKDVRSIAAAAAPGGL